MDIRKTGHMVSIHIFLDIFYIKGKHVTYHGRHVS